jgi:hypothetical protein
MSTIFSRAYTPTAARAAALALFAALSLGLAACGGGTPPADTTTLTKPDTNLTGGNPAGTTTVAPSTPAGSPTSGTPTTATAPDRTEADVTFTQTTFAEGVAVDPATGSLYLGTGGDHPFALLRATATQASFTDWLSTAGILPGTPSASTPSAAFIVGTRVQGNAIYFCVSNPFNASSSSMVFAYRLADQTKLAEFALPTGFCNDLAFDSAGNLFATVNRFGAASDGIYRLSASTVATGSASAASWATWHTPSTSTTFTLNGLAFDTANNRLLWAENSSPAGNTHIRASVTGASLSSPSSVITGLNMEIDGLQINSKGNLIAIDTATGAKLINLGTGALGTVTNLTDGAGCATTVAIYKADAWCSDAAGAVIRLVGAGDL